MAFPARAGSNIKGIPFWLKRVYEGGVCTRNDQWSGCPSLARVAVSASAALFLLLVNCALATTLPDIVLKATGDAALDAVLGAALNAPGPEDAQSNSGADPAQEWLPAVEVERQRLAEVMRGRGYLDARVEWAGDAAVADKPGQVVLDPVPGPLYRIGSIEIEGVDGQGLEALRDDIHLQIAGATGKLARGDVLSKLEGEVLWRIRSASFPFARITQRDLKPQPQALLATARMDVETGPRATFGTVSYSGLRRLSAEELARLQPFVQGAPYDPAVLERFSQSLASYPSVSSARLRLADQVDAAGHIDVSAEIREKPKVSFESSGALRLGTASAAIAIAVLALRQVSIAGTRSRDRRWPLWLDILLVLLLGVALAFVVLRLVDFAVPV